ncbi:MAG: Gfo/Idh/MocA family oxidoreductase, partial [Verrucomicrobiae bacterium]|nr:Gfo/Idh/MocA family oxidoreductase [Verrucomicrobiae bacterium]
MKQNSVSATGRSADSSSQPGAVGAPGRHLNRRSFLRRSVAAAGAATAAGMLPAPGILSAAAAGDRIRCVQVGCGGRGTSAHLDWIVNRHKEQLVAIVEPDEKRQASVMSWLKNKGQDPEKVQVFTDYRVMFEQLAKQIDAVFVATPNHHHALVAMMAMNLDKAVYCEKPLCRDIAEARKLREMARHSKAPTQMGNQGHCEEGYHRLCEYLQAGTIGRILETHSWTDRANGGVGPRPPTEPVPAGLHWDEWIGPSPYRDFHSDLHPHEWHGWYDFGNGSIGNMGCHVLDGVYWAMGVEHPTSVEVEQMRGGSDERYPTGSRIRWDCPARGDRPAFKAYWYEGLNATTKEEPKGGLHAAVGDARNLPPLLKKLEAEHDDEAFENSGSLYVGEKGVIYTGCYGGRMHIVPWSQMKETPEPPKTLPRPKDIVTDFLEACRAGSTKTAASFDYGARLTEFTLLANL